LIFLFLYKIKIMYTIVRNPLYDANQEIRELYRLLNEAQLRLRRAQRDAGVQGWLDWFWESVGW